MRTSVRFVLKTGLTCAALAACDDSTSPGGSTAISFESLHVGASHVCGRTADGTAYCWGTNGFAQLGSGDLENHYDPTAVVGDLLFEAIATGVSHTCGITPEGAAYCWGWNASAQLGDGTQENRSSPVQVTGGVEFTSISTGGSHTCGLTPGGSAYCWGSDGFGQLGDGTAGGTRGEPMPVASDSTFASIHAGWAHTCALTASGTAYCWGSNGHGEVGTGTAGANIPSPVVAAAGVTFTQIAPSQHDYTCGVAVDGTVHCWGHNDFAQLGRDTVSDNLAEVGPISSALTFDAVAVGGFHSCGLATDGSAHCWGWNNRGRTGDGTDTPVQEVPVPVVGGLTFRSLTLGADVTCGIASDDVPYCWGWQEFGQFGNGEASATKVTSPVPAAGHG